MGVTGGSEVDVEDLDVSRPKLCPGGHSVHHGSQDGAKAAELGWGGARPGRWEVSPPIAQVDGDPPRIGEVIRRMTKPVRHQAVDEIEPR